MKAFVEDVTARYPVEQIVLFGSRARGDARHDSDWDIVVCLSAGAEPEIYHRLLADATLQRHFVTFLDLFTLDERGAWDYPPWTKEWVDGHGYRGWFPDGPSWRESIAADAITVWQREQAYP